VTLLVWASSRPVRAAHWSDERRLHPWSPDADPGATDSSSGKAGDRSRPNTPGSGGSGGADESQDAYYNIFGLRISKEDLVTIGLAVAISYGIRW
jgi:signal peptidase I